MPSHDLSPDAASRLPEDLVEAGFFATVDAGFEHGLVVLAMGSPFWLVPTDSGYRLLVESLTLPMAREQLARFDRESVNWPPRPIPEPTPTRRMDFFMPLLWALVVLAVFRGQIVSNGRWENMGALDPTAVFAHGEWWRPFTALFLHADLGHLFSNVVSGVFVFAVVAATFGRWRGWLLLALASVVGNLVVAFLHYSEPYRSIGASTAVFAGLGLLTGRAICSFRKTDPLRRWRGVFVPLASGLILLGLYGAGEGHVDVVAHAAGFAAGLASGLVSATLPSLSRRRVTHS